MSSPKPHTAPGWSCQHRHLERHGPGWESVRDGIAGDGGWRRYLDRYAALLPVVS